MFNRLFRRRGAAASIPHALPDALRVIETLRSDMPDRGYTAADRGRDFREVFAASPAGRRVFAQILTRSRVCARSHVPGDAYETARREGMRDLGLWLLDLTGEMAPTPPATAEAEPAGDGTPS